MEEIELAEAMGETCQDSGMADVEKEGWTQVETDRGGKEGDIQEDAGLSGSHSKDEDS